MTFETRRLILRPWTDEDAPVLYMYAKEPLIGLGAGWAPPHNEHESLRMIQGPYAAGESYAIVLRETGEPIGNVELISQDSDMDLEDDEAEIGYWIGYPHWGNGYAVEAVRQLLSHAFSDLGMKGVWGKYFDENTRSGRVQAKAGFVYHHTSHTVDAMGDDRVVHYTYMASLPEDEE